MKYAGINPASVRGFRVLPTHPALAYVDIGRERWRHFENLAMDNPDTRIVGRGISPDGKLIEAYVACTDDEAKQRLMNA